MNWLKEWLIEIWWPKFDFEELKLNLDFDDRTPNHLNQTGRIRDQTKIVQQMGLRRSHYSRYLL